MSYISRSHFEISRVQLSMEQVAILQLFKGLLLASGNLLLFNFWNKIWYSCFDSNFILYHQKWPI